MTDLLITFDAADTDARDRDLFARQLRDELLALEVDEVQLAACNRVPRGAKGTAATSGDLLIGLANSAAFGAVMTSLVQVLRAWIARGQGRQVTMKDGERSLELTGASVEAQKQALEAFVRSMHDDPASER